MGNWQFNLPPLTDELLSSWLIRNAIANGSDPAHFTIAIWDKWRAWTIDLDRDIPIDKLNELSLSSGLDQNLLQSMTLFPTVSKILPNSLNKLTAWKWVIPTGGRNRTKVNGMHFCPICLSNKPYYFKKSGRLAWNTACSTHRCLLISHCPKCNTMISPHLVIYDQPYINLCHSCGFNLVESPTVKASDDALSLQSLLNEAIITEDSTCFPLDIKDIKDLFGVVRFFMVFFLSSYKNKHIAESLSIKFNVNLSEHKSNVMMEQRTSNERHTLMIATSLILKLSKHELIDLLLSLNLSQEAFMRDNKSNIAVIQKINSYLPRICRNKRKSPILKNKITPKSKAVVDALFEDIEPYL